MVSDAGLSGLVLLAFLIASIAWLLLARLFARHPTIEVWLAATALVTIASVLLAFLSSRDMLLDRTPVLVHAGFAGVILVWAALRRDTAVLAPPAGAAIRSGAVASLLVIPASGALLSLLNSWDIPIAPLGIGVVQAAGLAVAWLMAMRRTDRASPQPDLETASSGGFDISPTSEPSAARADPSRQIGIFVSYRRGLTPLTPVQGRRE